MLFAVTTQGLLVLRAKICWKWIRNASVNDELSAEAQIFTILNRGTS